MHVVRPQGRDHSASRLGRQSNRLSAVGAPTPPFPASVITACVTLSRRQCALLTGRQDSASKRLAEFMTEIGVINDHDGRDIAPMHSFRHRAKNRLRDTTPDDELRDYIGGWKGKKNSGRKYGNKHGAGYSIQKLKEAIDQIGF
jgi:hypothetical protein